MKFSEVIGLYATNNAHITEIKSSKINFTLTNHKVRKYMLSARSNPRADDQSLFSNRVKLRNVHMKRS